MYFAERVVGGLPHHSYFSPDLSLEPQRIKGLIDSEYIFVVDSNIFYNPLDVLTSGRKFTKKTLDDIVETIRLSYGQTKALNALARDGRVLIPNSIFEEVEKSRERFQDLSMNFLRALGNRRQKEKKILLKLKSERGILLSQLRNLKIDCENEERALRTSSGFVSSYEIFDKFGEKRRKVVSSPDAQIVALAHLLESYANVAVISGDTDVGVQELGLPLFIPESDFRGPTLNAFQYRFRMHIQR